MFKNKYNWYEEEMLEFQKERSLWNYESHESVLSYINET